MTDDFTDALEAYVRAVTGKKAENLIVLDVRELTSVADAFIICSGRSNRQVQAIADHIQAELKKQHKKPLSVEGLSEGHWALLDYGDVIIHIFYEPVRLFYDLEGLWMDAGRIKTDGMKSALPSTAERESFDE
ncbi:MAG: ribosome silencing factor [Desulfobacterales bacterium]